MNLIKASRVVRDNLEVSLETVANIQRAVADGRKPDRAHTTFLIRSLQAASAAALEVDARTAGQSEPKKGD